MKGGFVDNTAGVWLRARIQKFANLRPLCLQNIPSDERSLPIRGLVVRFCGVPRWSEPPDDMSET